MKRLCATSAIAVAFAVFGSTGTAHARGSEEDHLAVLRPVLTPGEAALVAATDEMRAGARASVVDRLRRLSNEHAGDEISGLAQILIAKSSLALGRFDDAATAARHPDVERTGLSDRALLILARAKARSGDFGGAASAYLRSIDAAQSNDVACSARLGAAAALQQIRQTARRVALLIEAANVCQQGRADVLFDLAEAHLAEGARDLALARLEEIEGNYPTSPQASTGLAHIAALLAPSGAHPQRTARQDFERRLARVRVLLEANQRTAAIAELRKLKVHKAVESSGDEVTSLLGQALSRLRTRAATREAKTLLASVPDASAFGAETKLAMARLAPEAQRASLFADLVARYPGVPAAEEALFSLGNLYQKDARYDAAAPYYRRLVDEFPESPYSEGAAMRAAFDSLRTGRAKEAAEPLEAMARRARSPAGFLYWAGMARLRNGEADRAVALLKETAGRFKNHWYGFLASSELAQMKDAATDLAPLVETPRRESAELPGPFKARLRQMLLAGLDVEARDELRLLGNTAAALEARALIEADSGDLRTAIIYMKRARPEYVSSEIKDLPVYVWKTIYPLRFEDALRTAALNEGLDPALVAALVCQESTFDERAKSVVGARGLMQIMPYTGRPLAKQLGVPRFSAKMLNQASTSLTFGTRYFRQMLERFDDRPEAALAAYNAGPHRVDRWLAPNPQMRTDEFAESIPFSETRNYVMIILGAREQYRKLYGLEPTPRLPPPTGETN